MTAHASEPFRSRRYLPWVMLALALIVGYFMGCQAAITGACVKSDTTYVALNVSQQSCQATCRTCTWVQNR